MKPLPETLPIAALPKGARFLTVDKLRGTVRGKGIKKGKPGVHVFFPKQKRRDRTGMVYTFVATPWHLPPDTPVTPIGERP